MHKNMQKMADIDKIAKGVAQGEPWLELGLLALGLARMGKKRLHPKLEGHPV